MLISFMIIEKILGSCHQILTVPLMSLVYPECDRNSTVHMFAFLSPAIKDSKKGNCDRKAFEDNKERKRSLS